MDGLHRKPTARFDAVAVVLVNPAGKRNIGSAARAMKNTGFRDLVLVDPPDFRSPEAHEMAPHSHDILDGARCFGTLEDALADRHLVFGVTARARFKKNRLTPLEAAALWAAARRGRGRKAALVFGPEDHGLSNEHLRLCGHLIGIPSHADLESFNLAQAVLLACHAFFLHRAGGLADREDRRKLASVKDRRRIQAAVSALLVEAGYQTPAREGPLQGTMSRLVFGGEIETRDVRNVLAAVRHLRHVLSRKRSI